MTKQYVSRLTTTIERAVQDHRPNNRLYFVVDELVAKGSPPSHIKVWATLHFLSGEFCCGEPGCHFSFYDPDYVVDAILKELHLEQDIEIEFEVRANYHPGVTFTIFRDLVEEQNRKDFPDYYEESWYQTYNEMAFAV